MRRRVSCAGACAAARATCSVWRLLIPVIPSAEDKCRRAVAKYRQWRETATRLEGELLQETKAKEEVRAGPRRPACARRVQGTRGALTCSARRGGAGAGRSGASGHGAGVGPA